MKTSRIRYDLTLEIQQLHAARRRNRAAARGGVACGVLLIGLCFGSAIPLLPPWAVALAAGALAYAAWGAHYLITRH